MSQGQPWILFLDFDGTMTHRDADYAIAEAVLGPRAEALFRPLEERYERLELNSADYFRIYFELLQVGPNEYDRHAREVALRPGAADLVHWCRIQGIEVRIVSEGLDVYIEPILAVAGFPDVTVSCNVAMHDGEGWDVRPPADAEPCGRCLNCKGHHARQARDRARRVAVVGNGASDLCAAREADLVLARDRLLELCLVEGIGHESWTTFDDVRRVLTRVCLDAGRN